MTTVVEAILAVFMAIGEWIPTAITALTPMFYVAETGLTFMGTLCICGLAFSVCFLFSILWTGSGVNPRQNTV